MRTDLKIIAGGDPLTIHYSLFTIHSSLSVSVSLLVVFGSAAYLKGAVDLFKEHYPGKLVGEGQL